jgi:chromate transporter
MPRELTCRVAEMPASRLGWSGSLPCRVWYRSCCRPAAGIGRIVSDDGVMSDGWRSAPSKPEPAVHPQRIGLPVIAREWGRIGVTGFGGPPAHIALLRRLCVQQNSWLSEAEFEDGIAATSLLPGPASTQLAIFCAWRLAGPVGAIVGGVCFIVPGLVIILALSALFLAHSPPAWVSGAAAGAGAAVPAVAVGAAIGLLPASWRRANARTPAAPVPAATGTPATGTPASTPAATGTAGIGTPASTSPATGTGATGTPASTPPATGTAGSGTPAAPAAPVASAASAASATHAAPRFTPARARWACYLLAGGLAANLAGEYLVAVLLGCGLLEWLTGRRAAQTGRAAAAASRHDVLLGLAAKAGVMAGVTGSLAWVALKVGALSFGGGFVIIPLMQHDAVHTYHWMTTAQFLSAVALGQVTPGPVVLTVGVVGYAAAGLAGGLLAVLIAFTPSFVFVLAGGPHFDKFRRSTAAQAFLSGAGPAAIGAIGGAAITLGLGLTQLWQVAVLAAAVCWLILLRRGVVSTLLGAAGVGVVVALAGGLS